MAAAQALFFDRKLCPLSPLDPIGAQAQLADLQARIDEEHLVKVSALLHRTEVSNFFSAVLELSPYIREVLLIQPRILFRLVLQLPERALGALMNEIAFCG